MTDNNHPARTGPVPNWYFVYMAGIGFVVVVLTVVAVIGIQTNNRQDATAAAANKARDNESTRLQDCFDEFATALSGGLPIVRRATTTRDDATGARDDALQDFVRLLIEAVADPDPSDAVEADRLARFGDAVNELDKAGRQLDRAQAALEKARAENPYPPPPSTFCSVNSPD